MGAYVKTCHCGPLRNAETAEETKKKPEVKPEEESEAEPSETF